MSELTLVVIGTLLLGALTGLLTALLWSRREQRELLDVYRHLLQYGRPYKPTALVKEPPPTVEERVLLEISETAKANLSEYIAKEGQVSLEQARDEADRLLAHFETTGALP